jgi:glycosyltransferase involved in cell wall biosynthesis
MRVLHVLGTSLQGKIMGGSGTYIKEYIKNSSGDMEVGLIGAHHDSEGEIGRWVTLKAGKRSYPFYSVDYSPMSDVTYSGGMPANARMIKNLWRHKRKMGLGDSLLHIHRPELVVPFLFFKRNPIVYTVHGVQNQIALATNHPLFKRRWFRALYYLMEGYVVRKANHVIVVSEEGERFYAKKYPKIRYKLTYLPTSVDIDVFKPMDKKSLRKMYGFSTGDKILLFVGRFHEQKGLDFLIRVFRDVKGKIPQSKLVLVGEGEQKEMLLRMIEELHVKDVVFMGTRSHDELPEILNCADVFMMPSLWEGMSIAALEALSSGVPIICSDVGQLGEIVIDDETGYLIRERVEDLFSEKVVRLLSSKMDFTANCRRMGEKYSSQNLAKKIEQIYHRVEEN